MCKFKAFALTFSKNLDAEMNFLLRKPVCCVEVLRSFAFFGVFFVVIFSFVLLLWFFGVFF